MKNYDTIIRITKVDRKIRQEVLLQEDEGNRKMSDMKTFIKMIKEEKRLNTTGK